MVESGGGGLQWLCYVFFLSFFCGDECFSLLIEFFEQVGLLFEFESSQERVQYCFGVFVEFFIEYEVLLWVCELFECEGDVFVLVFDVFVECVGFGLVF